jgi:hypothetical protein
VDVLFKGEYHRPKTTVFTNVTNVWGIDLACSKLTDDGLATKVWSLWAFILHTRLLAVQTSRSSLNSKVAMIYLHF